LPQLSKRETRSNKMTLLIHPMIAIGWHPTNHNELKPKNVTSLVQKYIKMRREGSFVSGFK